MCVKDCNSFEHCIECDEANNCISCEEGYRSVQRPDQDYIMYSYCEEIDCEEGCEVCNISSCKKCKDGYYLDGKVCKPDTFCSPYVRNCLKCSENDPLTCIECYNGFSLYGGTCITCVGYLIDGVCVPIIKKCIIAYAENGITYCSECDFGSVLSQDKRTCEKLSCNNTPGCLECNETNPYECLKCDEEKGFLLNGYFHQCECDSSSHKVIDGECQFTPYCQSGSHCAICLGDYPNYICRKCEKPYILYNGTCIDQCFEGYKHVPEIGCIENSPVDCDLLGCDECFELNRSICLTCSINFTHSIANPGTCVCEKVFDFINNKCVEPSRPVIPKEWKTLEITEYSIDETKLTIINKLSDADILYTLDVNKINSAVDTISVPKTDKNIQIIIPSSGQYKIDTPDSNKEIIIDTSDGSSITIPKKNNIVIKGIGTLNVETSDDDKLSDVYIHKLSMVKTSRKNNHKFQLKSSRNITIDEIDSYGEQKIIGLDSPL